MSTQGLDYKVCYNGSISDVYWEGRQSVDEAQFVRFLSSEVASRIADVEAGFEQQMAALATTGMQEEFLRQLFESVPEPDPWEIGEALAETLLQYDEECSVHFPWNTIRDKRTPRASLPGADLVGFCEDATGAFLFIGEVKTSGDTSHPPSVMCGKAGLTWQLVRLVGDMGIHQSLLRWLSARCQEEPYRGLFEGAGRRYVQSMGRDIRLMGLLMRDTTPDDRDLRNGARALADKVEAPPKVNLVAWYMPVAIEEWQSLLEEAMS